VINILTQSKKLINGWIQNISCGKLQEKDTSEKRGWLGEYEHKKKIMEEKENSQRLRNTCTV
jgi:hypothetical protein